MALNSLRLYLDEDVTWEALVSTLRQRGFDVLTVYEAGMDQADDDEQLAFSSAQGRVLVTYNTGDFARIHGEWIAAGREHAGIITIAQKKFAVGEIRRRLLRISVSVSPASIRNRLLYLSNWT